MPRSLPLNQFFVYLRSQAEASARARLGSYDPDKGGGGALPGFGFLRIGSPGSSQLVRIGSDSSAPRVQIPTGA